MIIAGEASGDLHGAHLVRAMRDRDPRLQFYGVGGDRMEAAGVQLIARSSQMAVMGAVEVLPRLGFILKVRRGLKKSLKQSRPALLILIDYPGFNLPLARFAHENGIRVFYYISPKVWAWRKKRIYALEQYVDRMALILPFEEAVYQEVHLDARFVGNPLLDTVRRTLDRGGALRKFGLQEGVTTVALLPGSRKGEVTRLLPPMLHMAAILKKRIPAVQFVLPLAHTLPDGLVEGLVKSQGVEVAITRENGYDAVGLADVAVVASGTATLETALLGVPMVIVYRLSFLSYWIGRAVVQVDHIGLVNLIAGRGIVPELIQGEATPERMADEAHRILTDRSRAEEIQKGLAEVRDLLGETGASQRAARLACEMIEAPRV